MKLGWRERAAEFQSLTGQKPALQQDLRRVFEDKDIDAVTIATCNRWGAVAALSVCQLEGATRQKRNACHDFFSGAQLVATSPDCGRLVQGGTQRHRAATCAGRFKRASVVLGNVYMARCGHYQTRDSLGFKDAENPPGTLDWNLWLGPAPDASPLIAISIAYNWHWLLDCRNRRKLVETTAFTISMSRGGA